MTDSKKAPLFKRIREILAKHEIEGITKNSLITILENEGTATRKTFYYYYNNGDLENENVMEMRVAKKQQQRCFPTKENQSLSKIEENLKYLKNLLDLIEKEPLIGDCFAFTSSISKLPFLELPKKLTQFNDISNNMVSNISGDKDPSSNFIIKGKTKIFSLVSRRDILKELPSFLIYYINNSKSNHPEQVKNEFMKMIFPYVGKCLEILRRDYSSSYDHSNQIIEKICLNLPSNEFATIHVVKNKPTADPLLEFLKILGRYYFCMSLSKSKEKIELTNEQKIISSFITGFYTDLTLKDEINQYLQENHIDVTKIKVGHALLSLIDEHQIMNKLQNTSTWKLIDSLTIDNDFAPLAQEQFYIQLFMRLELFSKIEKQYLKILKKL